MKNFFLLNSCLVLALIGHISSEQIVCYTTNWSQYRTSPAKFLPEDIDPYLCTHLIYSFAKLQDNKLAAYEWNDDSTQWSKGMYERTTDLKKVNSNLKVLLAVGGWNMGSRDFISLVSTDLNIDNFVSDTVSYLKTRNFDGLDLDWEYPTGYKDRFTVLVQKLKMRFATENLLLTAAVAAGKSNIDLAYNIQELSKYLDFLNVMTYDFHGSWETFTGHNAPLYKRSSETGDQALFNVDFTINYYISNGFQANKINIGLATYGRSFTLSDPNQNGLAAPTAGGGIAGQYTKEAGFLAYHEICPKLTSGWVEIWNSEHQVPYAYFGNQWVGYDNLRSLKLKVDYARSKGLGGVMFWAIDLDDFTGSFCNQGKYPLIGGVKAYLGNQPLPSSTTTTTSKVPPLTTTTKTPVTTTTAKISTTTTKSSGTTTKSSIQSLCYNGNGMYPDYSTGCQRFYTCQWINTIYERVDYQNCPEGTLFDKYYSYCNWKNLVVCQR